MNHNVLLIGAGYMGLEYAKVLTALPQEQPDKFPSLSFSIIGRGDHSSKNFTEKTGLPVQHSPAQDMWSSGKYTEAIVAVNIDQLYTVTADLIKAGCKKILVEKPGALNSDELAHLAELAKTHQAEVMIGYNRHFYSSVMAAQKLIEEDGGLLSMHFEFTEWNHQIEAIERPAVVKENWFLGNSTHVADLAFFIGGKPTNWKTYTAGSLHWHSKASMFAGAGVTDKNVIFSYCANWQSPGRWNIELMTANHRIHLRPMEKLHVQKTGSLAIENVPLDDRLDISYKPGLFLQTASFLDGSEHDRKIFIAEQAYMAKDVFDKILLGSSIS